MGRSRRNSGVSRPGRSGVTAVAGAPRPTTGVSSKKLHLGDRADRVNEAQQSFAKDPLAAISSLEELRRDYAPDPLVLHALCLMHQRNGDVARAVEVAREAFPLCFRRGLGFLAAEIFDALEADAQSLGLGREELLALGGALGRTVYWRLAFRALASVLIAEPSNEQATVELLRMAEHQLNGMREPAEALQIFQFLAAIAPESPLRDRFEVGIGAAEVALAQADEPI